MAFVWQKHAMNAERVHVVNKLDAIAYKYTRSHTPLLLHENSQNIYLKSQSTECHRVMIDD